MAITTLRATLYSRQDTLLTLIPIGIYFGFYFCFSIDAPQFDDFQTIIRSAITFDGARDLKDWLLSQYGEHRIAYLRFITVVVQRLLGRIDFVWLGLIGNASLIGVAIVLFRWFKQWGLERYFLPVPFILFQMNYHHNTFTAMMALQNLTILFWALITLWWVSKGQGWQLWAALLTAVLAVYTSGNGIMVVLTAVLVLAYRRQWQHVAVWIIIGGGAVISYIWGLDTGKPNYNLIFLATHALQLSAFMIFFSGSYFDLLPNVLMSSLPNSTAYTSALFYIRLLLPFIMGLLLISGSMILIGQLLPIRQYLKRGQSNRVIRWMTDRFVYRQEASLFPTAVLIFIMFTAGVVALGRIDTGLAQSFAIRYKIYAPLMVICCYAALLVNISQPSYRVQYCRLLLLISMVIGINSYGQNLNQIQSNRRTALSGLYNMDANKSWAVYGGYYGNIDSVMQIAIDKHMYQINLAPFNLFNNLNHELKRLSPTMAVDLDSASAVVHLRVLHSQLDISLLTTEPTEGPYFVVYNAQRKYVFPAQLDRNIVGSYKSSFHCYMEQTSKCLTPGFYKIAILTNCRTRRQIYHTHRSINLLAQR